ncbi:M56 family metallopeptidase [Paraglaciecola sp.]|uniref:M56 family metallopeptidase n=1 Tax=Paraglaciecola sp. TaxID=1920173 RepID=UPI003EF9FC97
MINWLLSQLLLVSSVTLILLFIEAKALKFIGAKTVYLLWLLLPLVLLVNNMPQDITVSGEQPIYHYIVDLKTYTPQVEHTSVWLLLWTLGTLSILSLAAITQYSFNKKIVKQFSNSKMLIPLPEKLKVFTHSDITGPVVCGIFRPTLLLPVGFKDNFTQQQQVLILQHELTHYRRSDNVFNGIALIILAMFWFNPLFWLAYKAFRRSQELACDEAVLKNTTTAEKISYSKALIQCAQKPLSNFAIYSPYSEKKSMFKRIHNIKNKPQIKPSLIGLSLVFSASLLGGVAFAGVAEKATQTSEINMAKPILRIEPKYPIQAVKNKQEGSVILEFDITSTGNVDNVKVIDSFPDGVFDKVAKDALVQWEYKPRIQGGQAQRQTGLKVQLDFRMGPTPKNHIAATNSIERIKVSH